MALSFISNRLSLVHFDKGLVDALICSELTVVELRSRGIEPIAHLRSWNMPIAGSGVQTTASWVRENRDTARRFIKSLVEAIALMKRDKEVAFRAMSKWFNITDREKQQANYEAAVEIPRKPYPAVDGIKKTMELYDSHEMRKYKPEDFYDDSFIRELDQSGYIDSLYE